MKRIIQFTVELMFVRGETVVRESQKESFGVTAENKQVSLRVFVLLTDTLD